MSKRTFLLAQHLFSISSFEFNLYMVQLCSDSLFLFISSPRMCELMFEKYSAPAVFLSKDAVLATYACGKTGGLVIDIGASGTVVTPVQDGWVDSKAVCRSLAGSRLIDAHIRQNIFAKYAAHLTPPFRLIKSLNATQPSGVLVTQNTALGCVHPSYEAYMNLEVGKDIKETLAKLSDTALQPADARYSIIPTIPYELPDGTVVDVNIERFQIPELYFDPTPMTKGNVDLMQFYAHIGASNPAFNAPGSMESVPKIVGDSIVRSDNDVQAMLLANMIVTGGGACIEGLTERLKMEGQ